MSLAGYTELGMTLVEGGGGEEEEEDWEAGYESVEPSHEAGQGEHLALCIYIMCRI